jgi:hypothetical protein
LLALAVVLGAAPARASAVEVRCPRVVGTARGELQARARLLLSSAGLETATVVVECDARSARLVWIDGGVSPIDEQAGLVEGALDAIEDRIGHAAAARGSSPPARATSSEPFSPAADPFRDSAPSPRSEADEERPGPSREVVLEGGVGLSAVTEMWTAHRGLGVGPRLDIGVRFGNWFTLVIAEGARFSVNTPQADIMAFDLQWGIGFGAPYHKRTGLGLVLLGGAERLAAASSQGSPWVWGATASLGVRGCADVGGHSLVLGLDGVARSATIYSGDHSVGEVSTVSGMVSIGWFMPALTRSSVNLARR